MPRGRSGEARRSVSCSRGALISILRFRAERGFGRRIVEIHASFSEPLLLCVAPLSRFAGGDDKRLLVDEGAICSPAQRGEEGSAPFGRDLVERHVLCRRGCRRAGPARASAMMLRITSSVPLAMRMPSAWNSVW